MSIPCTIPPGNIAVLPFFVSNTFRSKVVNKVKPAALDNRVHDTEVYLQKRLIKKLIQKGQKSNPPFYVLEKASFDKIVFDSCLQLPHEMEMTPAEYGRILHTDAVIVGNFYAYEQEYAEDLWGDILLAILFDWWLNPNKDDNDEPSITGDIEVYLLCTHDESILWQSIQTVDTNLWHHQLVRNAVRKSLRTFPKTWYK